MNDDLRSELGNLRMYLIERLGIAAQELELKKSPEEESKRDAISKLLRQVLNLEISAIGLELDAKRPECIAALKSVQSTISEITSLGEKGAIVHLIALVSRVEKATFVILKPIGESLSPVQQLEYELKIDQQTENFLAMRQKLTYFLTTASVAIVVFLVEFLTEKHAEIGSLVWLAIISSGSGLLAACFSLIGHQYALCSYTRHLNLRHERKNFEDLEPKDKTKWKNLNTNSRGLRTGSFVLIVIQIIFAGIFFVSFFLSDPVITKDDKKTEKSIRKGKEAS